MSKKAGRILAGLIGGAAKGLGDVAAQTTTRLTAQMLQEQRDKADEAKERRIEAMAGRNRKLDSESRRADVQWARDEEVKFQKDQTTAATALARKDVNAAQGLIDAPIDAKNAKLEHIYGAPETPRPPRAEKEPTPEEISQARRVLGQFSAKEIEAMDVRDATAARQEKKDAAAAVLAEINARALEARINLSEAQMRKIALDTGGDKITVSAWVMQLR